MAAAQHLSKDGWSLAGMRRRHMPASTGGVDWFNGDLREPKSLDQVFKDPRFPDVTHILYAPTPDGRSPAEYAAVYAEGLPRFLDAMKRNGRFDTVKRVVLVTSTAMWGPSDEWVDEETPADQGGFRAENLLQAESALKVATGPGIGVTLRLSGLYNERHIAWLAGKLSQGAITVPEGSGHWVNRIHRDDAASACAHLLQLDRPADLYIGTDSHPIPKAELYEALCEALGFAKPERVPEAPTGKRLSNARLRRTGWVPRWPNMIDGYKACALKLGATNQ